MTYKKTESEILQEIIPWRIAGSTIGSRDWFYPEVIIGRAGFTFKWVGGNSQYNPVEIKTYAPTLEEGARAFMKETERIQEHICKNKFKNDR